jgi:hypothetical protein
LGRKTNLPFLYEKLMGLLEGDSEWGKTDTDRTTRTISLKYKLSKNDLEICMTELQKMNHITLKKSHNGPTSIFINRRGIS